MNDFNSFVLNGSENEHEILRLEQPRLENNEGILLLEQPHSAKQKSQEDHGCVEKRANLNFFSPVKRLTHKEYREMALKAERLRRPNASPKVRVPDVEEKIPSPVKTPPESPLSTTPPFKRLFLENSSGPARNSQQLQLAFSSTLSQQTHLAGKRKREEF